MKKVLIITDNKLQYERIKSVIEEKKRTDVRFDFYHSNIYTEIWEHEDFKNKDKIIDVKKKSSWIIENYELVISVHCFQFFPPQLVNNIRCVNIHPGYNPINRGWYPQVFAIINDLQIGATIHEMDEKLDNGPIIARNFVEKYPWDTSFTLYQRVLEEELRLFSQNFNKLLDNSYEVIKPETAGNMFSKKDFYDLCEIDLNQIVSFKDAINRLRSLTHGDYFNAHFVDHKSGKKVFLKLSLTPEDGDKI